MHNEILWYSSMHFDGCFYGACEHYRGMQHNEDYESDCSGCEARADVLLIS